MKIDTEALQKTKAACHQELDYMTRKYNTSHMQIIYQYAIREFKSQFLFAMMGLFIVCFVSYSFQNIQLFCIVTYFMLLGSMAILEHLKNEIFKMKELMSVSYINESRSFLYRSVVMAMFQLFIFIVLCYVLPLQTVSLMKAIIYALFPVYLTQVICLSFMKYMRNVFGILVTYFSFYLTFLFVMEYSMIMNYLSVSMCIKGMFVIVVIYAIETILLYKRRKKGDIIWN